MEWTDPAILLSSRRHGESAAIVVVLARSQGRHAGLVPGGARKDSRALLQPGNRVTATWRARLADQLGHFRLEPMSSPAAACLDDPPRLAALAAACALLDATLLDRAPHPELHDATVTLLETLTGPGWAEAYARWEVGLLADLGFGLDLGHCAVTGSTEDLAYVSPRTGRAVSVGAAGPYRDRLLRLPGFLGSGGPASGADELSAALRLTGHFLERLVFGETGRPIPPARQRLIDRLTREAAISSRSAHP